MQLPSLLSRALMMPADQRGPRPPSAARGAQAGGDMAISDRGDRLRGTQTAHTRNALQGDGPARAARRRRAARPLTSAPRRPPAQSARASMSAARIGMCRQAQRLAHGCEIDAASAIDDGRLIADVASSGWTRKGAARAGRPRPARAPCRDRHRWRRAAPGSASGRQNPRAGAARAGARQRARRRIGERVGSNGNIGGVRRLLRRLHCLPAAR